MEKVRKQLDQLKLDDLKEYPVWEFATDEEDEYDQEETTIRPWLGREQPNPREGIFAVLTEFTTASDRKFLGFSTPSDMNDFGYIQPTIITDSGKHVGFWQGMYKPSTAELKRFYEDLSVDAKNLFPLRYKAVVEARGVTLEGSIEGFLFSPDPENNEVEIVH